MGSDPVGSVKSILERGRWKKFVPGDKNGEKTLKGRHSMNYSWPPLPASTERPVWTGHEFRVGDRALRVLSYETGGSGWTDELTSFHEEKAGADHSIDLASREYALGQIRKFVPVPAPFILEVGCSSGYFLRLLRERMPQAFLIGSDYVPGPLVRLSRDLPDLPLLQFDLTRCPLPDRSLDAVVLLNVLEHIRDDSAAMAQVLRILKLGAVAVIEVPAGPRLYDAYDKILMHERRYSLGQLKKLVLGAGFEILTHSHLGFFLYPGFWWVKRRNRKYLAKEEKIQREIIAKNIGSTKESRILKTILRIELAMGRYFAYPFGIRCLLTCRRIS
jgi:SAM-dependent methyltransferase